MSKSRSNTLFTVRWRKNSLLLIDQTKLPTKLCYFSCNTYQDVAYAIRKMIVRGAPAIGVTAAFGLVLAAKESTAKNVTSLQKDIKRAYSVIRSTRPTAINLQWGLDRIIDKIQNLDNVSAVRHVILKEAMKMAKEDISINKSMGLKGEILFSDGDTVMTHCNAGSLATVAYGTALGVIRAANASGKNICVVATETRPVMQGSRLTAFELKHDKIDVRLIPDTAVGYTMSKGKIQHVIVGADRVLRSGHVFNKIGTYQLAVLAKRHKIPFYVAAPISTFDFNSNVDDIIVEERSKNEVTKIGNKAIAPKNVKVMNPAFDITPPTLITKIITEKGIIEPPYTKSIKKMIAY
ncbi:MAG: S-methyl-5-thioribose-1-phosphate isomerase [Nitrososphaeraceae archaeon]